MTVLAKRVLAGLIMTGLLFAVGRFLFVRWQEAQAQLNVLRASVSLVEEQRRVAANEAALATARLRTVLQQQQDRNEYYANYVERLEHALSTLDTSCKLDPTLPGVLSESYDTHIRGKRSNQ